MSQYIDLLPAYPGEAVLSPVRTPAPPLLDHELPLHKNAVELSLVYVQTVKHFTRYTYTWDSPLKHDRFYVTLLGAAKTMLAKRIPPQAWVKFSLDVFFKYGRGRYPKPGFVFSAKRLADRMEWFGWEEAFNTAQAVVWVAPEHHKLLRQYERMRQALLGCGKLSAPLVQEIVEDVLPRDVYEKLARVAQGKYERRQRAMAEALQRREWIWS